MDCCDWTGKSIFQAAGGRVVPSGNPVFDNLTALAQFRVDPSQNGLLVWVLSVRDIFVYENDSDDSEDGITVVLPAAGSIGRWIRLQIPNEHWARQGTWFINISGSEENSGQTESLPLKTHAELARRVKGLIIGQPTVITLQSSLPEVLRLDVTLADGSPAASLTYHGLQLTPLLRADGTISTVTAQDVAGTAGGPPNIPLSFTDTTLTSTWDQAGPNQTSLIGRRIRITSSTNTNNVNAVAWLALQVSDPDPTKPTHVRSSSFVNGTTVLTPVVGDRYVVEDLMTVHGFDLMVRRRGHGVAVCTISDLALKRAEPVYNSRFKSDNAEAQYVIQNCFIQSNMLEVDRGNIQGCQLRAAESENRIVIEGAAVQVFAGLVREHGYVIETPSSISFAGNHLVQGKGDLGMVVRAPVVDIEGLAFLDCNPALVVHHGGAVRVGFENHTGDVALWGAGNGAAADSTNPARPAVVIEPGALLVYDSVANGTTPANPPLIAAATGGLRFSVGGVTVPDERPAPFFNAGSTGNGAGLVNRNGSGIGTGS